MPTFAAIDIGANSVRLKVARLRGDKLEALAEDREVTRLGGAVFATGALSTEAMAHAVKVLQRFHRTVQAHGAVETRVIATSALRDADNAQAFLDWVKSSTGWTIEVVSGLEEGRLIHLAIVSSMPHAARARAVLFDLGGGSCEVTYSDIGEIRWMASLPLGAVRLTNEFLHHDPPRKNELERMNGLIVKELRRIDDPPVKGVDLVIATSGTAAALSAMRARRKQPDRSIVSTQAVIEAAARLSALNAGERTKVPGIGTRRAEIIVAGSFVFANLLKRLDLPGFQYSPLGLRDGVLAQMAADFGGSGKILRQIETERRSAVVAVARAYDADMDFATRVRDFALRLFDDLARVHRLPEQYRAWLSAAAMLHEIGSYVNRAGRHRHAHYLIVHSELFGFTVRQRRIIAAIARYVGRSKPSPEQRPMRVLPPGEQVNVRKAVVLLRLSRALQQSRTNAVREVEVAVRDRAVSIEITTGRRGAELELWAIEKERSYFAEVFGRPLVVATS